MTCPLTYDASSLDQERHDAGDVLGLPDPAQRDLLGARGRWKSSTDILSRSAVAAVISVAMKPGRDRVDRDAERPELDGQGLGEPLHAGLRRGVVGLAPVAQRRGARQVDDPAPPGLGHEALHGLAHQERAPQVRAQDCVPVVLGHLEQQVVAGDPGVVDEHGRAAQPLGQPRHRCARPASASPTSAPRARRLGRRRLRWPIPLPRRPTRRDPGPRRRTRPGQAQGGGGADAARRAVTRATRRARCSAEGFGRPRSASMQPAGRQVTAGGTARARARRHQRRQGRRPGRCAARRTCRGRRAAPTFGSRSSTNAHSRRAGRPAGRRPARRSPGRACAGRPRR